jgi:MFS family permease
MMRQPDRVWTRGFVLLCGALFTVSANQSMLSAVLALYVVYLGGTATIAGLVFFAFSLPSFSMRPLVGHWADSWSLVGVFTVGALALGVSGLLYLVPVLAMLFLVGAMRGVGWAGAMTGSYTLLAHLSPASRRGEAAGYFTSVFDAALITCPALALWLLTQPFGGYRSVFLVASGLALFSAALSQFGLVPSVRRVSQASMESSQRGQPGPAVVIDRSVLLPTALSFCLTLSQPAVISFLPLFAKHQGIKDIGLFYIISGIASLMIRPVLGRVSDRVGQGYTLAGGFIAQMFGMALIAGFGTLPYILLGGVFNAAGNAMAGASTLAVAMGLADPERRGAGMATFTISFQLGAGLGSLLAGAIIDLSGFRAMYLTSIAVLAGGLLLTLATWARLARVSANVLPAAQPATGTPEEAV